MNRSPTAATGASARRPPANPLYALARLLFAVGVDTYFRRIEVRDPERLPRTGPVLIVANHPAGMTDAVILSTQLDRPVHFIAMAPLFKPWLRGVAMRAIGALPVYRQRDDPALMSQNDDTFRACHELFDDGGVVAIFPEGHSDLDRRLLQVKTGAARLALAQATRGDPAGPLTLLPVGLYFEDRTRFQSEVILSVGEPIPLEPHIRRAEAEPREAVQDLTQVIQRAIESLIQIIPEPEFTQLVHELEKLYIPRLQERGDERHVLELKRRVAACVDHFRRTDPERVVAVGRQLKHYLRTLDALDLHDAAVREVEARGDWRVSHARRAGLALAGLVPALVGALVHWVPYDLCGRLALQLAPHPTAISAAKLVAGMILFPVWWVMLGILAWRVVGWPPERVVTAIAIVVVLGVFAAGFQQWWDRQPGFIRVPLFATRRRRRLVRVAAERRELMRIFDKAREDFLAEEAAPETVARRHPSE
jgi:1-acyl-sn-glycerol-3-phosphate acyltransferase